MSTVKWISKTYFTGPLFILTQMLSRQFREYLYPCPCSLGGLLKWALETLWWRKLMALFVPSFLVFPSSPLAKTLLVFFLFFFSESCLSDIMVVTTDHRGINLMENISWFSDRISYSKCSNVWIIQNRLLKSHHLNNLTFQWRTLRMSLEKDQRHFATL